MEVYPPLHGPHSGVLLLDVYDGIPSLISSTIQHVLGHLPYLGPRFQAWVEEFRDAHQPLWPTRPQTVAYIQTAILLLGALAFYLRAIATRRTTSALLVCGGLAVCWVLWGYGDAPDFVSPGR
jgi:hypothetical protein